MNRRRYWLWRAVDQDGIVLDTQRDTESCIAHSQRSAASQADGCWRLPGRYTQGDETTSPCC